MLGPGSAVDSNTRSEVLKLYSKATSIDPNSYLAWHQWGLCNYRAIEDTMGNNSPNNANSRNINSASNLISNKGYDHHNE